MLLGNVAGAMAMYAVGRRFGADWTEKKFHLRHKESAESALALLVCRATDCSRSPSGGSSRAIRAMVAPFAGAFRASIFGTAAAITFASGTWYGLVTWIAFRAGSNWEDLVRNVGRIGGWAAVVAVMLAGALAFTLYRHRKAHA